MNKHQEYFDANLARWDECAEVHSASSTDIYPIEAFKRGQDTLLPIERAELGDVRGRDLIHLQCHFGMDTLSLARRGARVTGVDFSPKALAAGRKLSEETGIPARFVECNLYDAPDHVEGQFDVVYVSWGAINWLPDIEGWARVVGHFLKPGGFLYLAEGHPAALALEEVDGMIQPHYDYFQGRDPVAFDEAGTYTDAEIVLRNKRSYEWVHPLGAIINALLSAGMRLDYLNEFDSLPWQLFPSMVRGDDGQFRLADGMSSLPLAFSLKAVKH